MMSELGDQTVNRFYYPSKAEDHYYTVTDVKKQPNGSRIVTIHTTYLRQPLFRDPSQENVDLPNEVVEYPTGRWEVANGGFRQVEDYDIVKKKWVESEQPQAWFPHRLVRGTTRERRVDEEFHFTQFIDQTETVKVIGGTFQATPIHVGHWQRTLSQPVIKGTYWWVRGIGNVKTMHDGEVVMELVAFRPAKQK